jgi:hypothetical protein
MNQTSASINVLQLTMLIITVVGIQDHVSHGSVPPLAGQRLRVRCPDGGDPGRCIEHLLGDRAGGVIALAGRLGDCLSYERDIEKMTLISTPNWLTIYYASCNL